MSMMAPDRYIIQGDRLAAMALANVMTCNLEGINLPHHVLDEVRLAHSVLTNGLPHGPELTPILGAGWGITRRRDHPNPVTYKRYYDAEIEALATRLGVSQAFVRSRLNFCKRPDFHKKVAR